MKDFCIYCLDNEIEVESGVCQACLDKMRKPGREDYTKYLQAGIADMMCIAEKIDACFELISEDKEAALNFHKRRVDCITECIGHVNISLFNPKSKDDIIAYIALVKSFWSGEITKEKAKRIRNDFASHSFLKAPIYSPEYEIRITLVGLIDGEDMWDWAWYQYMELSISRLNMKLDKQLLIGIMEKYFTNELLTPLNIGGGR